jgi:hypothetical protein
MKKNQSVTVTDPKPNDLWSHSFCGTIIEVKQDTVVVEDQDGDCFEVDNDQIEVENGL